MIFWIALKISWLYPDPSQIFVRDDSKRGMLNTMINAQELRSMLGEEFSIRALLECIEEVLDSYLTIDSRTLIVALRYGAVTRKLMKCWSTSLTLLKNNTRTRHSLKLFHSFRYAMRHPWRWELFTWSLGTAALTTIIVLLLQQQILQVVQYQIWLSNSFN